MSRPKCQTGSGIKVEVLAAITAALAAYGCHAEKYRVSNVVKSNNPWRKAGIIEIMLGREIEREYL